MDTGDKGLHSMAWVISHGFHLLYFFYHLDICLISYRNVCVDKLGNFYLAAHAWFTWFGLTVMLPWLARMYSSVDNSITTDESISY